MLHFTSPRSLKVLKGWVDFKFECSIVCLPNSAWADGNLAEEAGLVWQKTKLKVNLTQVPKQMWNPWPIIRFETLDAIFYYKLQYTISLSVLLQRRGIDDFYDGSQRRLGRRPNRLHEGDGIVAPAEGVPVRLGVEAKAQVSPPQERRQR